MSLIRSLNKDLLTNFVVDSQMILNLKQFKNNAKKINKKFDQKLLSQIYKKIIFASNQVINIMSLHVIKIVTHLDKSSLFNIFLNLRINL
jgi:hypothetical protein